MNAPAPLIDPRERDHILAELLAKVPGFTPELRPQPSGAGQAYVSILAGHLDSLREGLNGLPLRSRLAFLEMLGNSQLPAQSARAPLKFKLLDTCQQDVVLPARSQVAAKLPPPPPSILAESSGEAPNPPLFFTDKTVMLSYGRLAALYSVDPTTDTYVDHTAVATSGFTLFSPAGPTPHSLYIGHDQFLALAGSAEISVTFDFGGSEASALRRPLLLDWWYFSKNGWLPLRVLSDDTARFTQDGRVQLIKDFGPDAKQEEFAGRTSYWIRADVSARHPSGRVAQAPNDRTITLDDASQFLIGDVVTIDGIRKSRIVSRSGVDIDLERSIGAATPGDVVVLADSLPPLRPEGTDAAGALPQLDRLRLRVGFSKTGLKPDNALALGAPVEIGNVFLPFGAQPQLYGTFYIGSTDVFSRAGARVTIDIAPPPSHPAISALPTLSFEYFNGDQWLAFDGGDEFNDGTDAFTKSGLVTFISPRDWKKGKVNDEENFWLRVRIVSGDYGKPLQLKVVTNPDNTHTVTAEDSTLKPPAILGLSLSYTYFTLPELPDHCLAENDMRFTDRTEDCRWPRRLFSPFEPIGDRRPALHFGFTQKLPGGLVSLFAAVSREPGDSLGPSAFAWEYLSDRGWVELPVLDETDGFRQSGVIQFVGAPDAIAAPGLGGSLYRLRAQLKPGLSLPVRSVDGIWLNTLWGRQGESITDDLLGASSGEPDQVLSFPIQRVPVLPGERIEVREWTGRGEDWRTAVAGVPDDDLRLDRDPATGDVLGVWVRWSEQPHLYGSGPTSRDYVIERSRGIVRFGDLRNGLIPPAGAKVRATYATGGGLTGNVRSGQINEVRSGVGYLESVTNPLPAQGGTAVEDLVVTGERAPQRIRHRGRAVTPSDYEWLAREATPEVARARCLATTGESGRIERGKVTLVLVPWSQEPRPMPTVELMARVRAHLRERLPAGIADGIRLVPSAYVDIVVRADITPLVPDEAAAVEARVRAMLSAYLHPLTGGEDRRGWDYGTPVYLSTISRLIETTPGVDYCTWIRLEMSDVLIGDVAVVPAHALVSSGDHQLKLSVGGASRAA